MSNNIPVNGWPQLKDLEAVQPTLDRLDKIEAWKRTVKEETFTGDDITIENALALPARSLITSINAIQDLHGYDKPWAEGAGKNKLPMTVEGIKSVNQSGTWDGNVYTHVYGVQFTILTDNDNNVIGIKLNGTPTDNIIVDLGDIDFYANKTYILNGAVENNVSARLAIMGIGSDYGDSFSYTPTADDLNRRVIIYITGRSAINNLIFHPMIRLSTESDASFAPYSNICPISGRTAAVITRSDGDEISEDFTIQLGTTVYGADINWDTGVVTVKTALDIFDGSNDENWTRYNSGSASAYAMTILTAYEHKFVQANNNIIANYLKALSTTETWGNYDTFITSNGNTNMITGMRDITTVEAWKAYLASNPLQVEYELATPTTIQLTPTMLEMLKGYNRVTLSDGYGTIELKALTGANWS